MREASEPADRDKEEDVRKTSQEEEHLEHSVIFPEPKAICDV